MWGWRDQKKGKRTHGHGQQCGDCWEEEGVRRLNGNRKNTKIKHKIYLTFFKLLNFL